MEKVFDIIHCVYTFFVTSSSPFFFKVEKDDVNNFWPDVLDSIFFLRNAPTLGVLEVIKSMRSKYTSQVKKFVGINRLAHLSGNDLVKASKMLLVAI